METFYLFCALMHLTKEVGELGIRCTGVFPESGKPSTQRAAYKCVCKSHSQESDAIFWPPRILHSCQALFTCRKNINT